MSGASKAHAKSNSGIKAVTVPVSVQDKRLCEAALSGKKSVWTASGTHYTEHSESVG
jgi:hypothetical protein